MRWFITAVCVWVCSQVVGMPYAGGLAAISFNGYRWEERTKLITLVRDKIDYLAVEQKKHAGDAESERHIRMAQTVLENVARQLQSATREDWYAVTQDVENDVNEVMWDLEPVIERSNAWWQW